MNNSLDTLQENLDKLFKNSKLIELVSYTENEKSINNYIEVFKKFFNLSKIDLFEIDFKSEKIAGENYYYFRNSIKIDFSKKDFKDIEIIQIYFFIKQLKENNYNINYTGIELKDLEEYFEEIDCSNGLCKAKQQFVFDLENILSNQSISVKNHIIALVNDLKIKTDNIKKELENNSITIKNILAGENKIDEFNEILNTFLYQIENEENEEKIIELIKSFSQNQKTIGFFVKSKISNFLSKSKKIKGKEIIDEFIKEYEKIDLFYNYFMDDFEQLRKKFFLLYQYKLLLFSKKYLAFISNLNNFNKEEIKKSILDLEKSIEIIQNSIKDKIGKTNKNLLEEITQIPETNFKTTDLKITF